MTGRMIAIDEPCNGAYFELHLNFEAEAGTHGPHFQRPLVEDGDYWDKLSDEAKDIVRALMSIEGVCFVRLGSYAISVAKGRLFDSATVAEAIKAALSNVLDDTQIVIGLPD